MFRAKGYVIARRLMGTLKRQAALKPTFIFILMICILISSPLIAEPIVNLNPGPNDNRIETIENVVINGTSYTATFHHGISYTQLVAISVTPIVFPDDAIALEAAVAIDSALQDPISTSHAQGDLLTLSIHIPIWADYQYRSIKASTINVAWGSYPPTHPQSGIFQFAPSYVGFTDVYLEYEDPPSRAWVTFIESTAVVPEPSSVVSFGIGGMILGSVWYRRRAKQIALSDR